MTVEEISFENFLKEQYNDSGIKNAKLEFLNSLTKINSFMDMF